MGKSQSVLLSCLQLLQHIAEIWCYTERQSDYAVPNLVFFSESSDTYDTMSQRNRSVILQMLVWQQVVLRQRQQIYKRLNISALNLMFIPLKSVAAMIRVSLGIVLLAYQLNTSSSAPASGQNVVINGFRM